MYFFLHFLHKRIKFIFIFILISSAFAIFLYFKIVFLLKIPPIWPDEAVYSELARNIITSNKLGLALWGNTIPGVSQNYLIYPPIFPYTVALWTKIFGFSIISQRSLTVFISVLFFIAFYFFIRQFTPGKVFRDIFSLSFILIPFALAIDYNFFQTTTISRVEILMLLVGISSAIFFLKSVTNDSRNSTFFSAISGTLASITFLLHFLGAFFFLSEVTFILITKRFDVFKNKKFYVFNISFLIPSLTWFTSVLPHFEIFKKQATLIFFSRAGGVNWYQAILNSYSYEQKTLVIIYLTISVLFVISSIFMNKQRYILMSLLLFFSWIFLSMGKILWYSAFILPFIYASLNIMIIDMTNRKLPKKARFFLDKGILLSILFLTLGINSWIMYQNFMRFPNQAYLYSKLAKRVLEVVPTGKSIYLSSIPDLYHAFRERGDNKLYLFPSVPININDHLDLLNQVDYMIYNASYEGGKLSPITQEYIQENSAKEIIIKEPLQYEISVIELKPKKARKDINKNLR